MHPTSIVLDEVSDIVADFNEAGVPSYLNRAGRLFFGLDGVADGVLPGLDQWYSPDDASKVRTVGLPAASRDGRWQDKVRLRDGRGGDHLVEQIIVPLRSRKGVLSGFTTVIRLDRQISGVPTVAVAPEGMFSEIFRVSPYAAVITDLETRRIVDVSDRLCEFLGQKRDDLVGSINDRGVWADPQECQRAYADLEKTGVIYDREARLVDHAGRVRTGFFSGVIITRNGRRCVHSVFEDLTELHAARRALLDSEERFAKAFYQSPDPYVISEFGTDRMLEVNDAYCRLFGVTRDESVGRKNSELGLWADMKHRDEFVDRLCRDGVVTEMEQHRRKRSGETVICLVTAFRMEIGGQRCNLYRLRDITRERQAERALRESEEKFSKAFHASPDPIAIGEFPSGRITEVNDAFCRLFGYPRQEIIGRNGAELGLWADLRDRERFVELLRAEGTVHGLEADKVTRDGRRITCRITSNRMEIKGQARIVTRFADITEQRRTERALRDSEEKFSKAFHANPDASAIATMVDGRFIDVTAGFSRLHGFSREEIIGRTVAELRLWADEAQRDAVMRRLDGAGAVVGEPVALLDRNGGVHHCLFSAVTLDIAGQRCRLSIARDVTEQQRLEDQLRQAQKMESIGQLAGGVAHDFNNILTVIQGHTSFLLQDRLLAPSVRDSVLQIQQSAVLAADLTRQLLLFSRRKPIQPGPLSLTEVVGRTKRLLDRVIGEQIVLDVSVPADLPAVNADAGMVEQVLLNLVVNARDAMPGGGHIAISGSTLAVDDAYVGRTPQARPGRFAGLMVSDTGGGIPPEILPRIFDPFFTTKEEGKGTGLGLATVYGIVQQHGGWIEVESRASRGTTFAVWFPLAGRAPEKVSASAASPTITMASGHETVLVVEDKAEVRAVLQAVLERFGYDVLVADDGPGAVRCWMENRARVALLFTDVMMPGGMTGRDLAERLRREQPGLKVIFCSGYDANVLDAATLKAPGTRFISKPFDIARLVSLVRELLDAN